MPQLVVFDLDGTLADSHEAIVQSFLYAVEDVQLPPVSPAEVTSLIGLPLTRMFEIVAPEVHPDTRQAAIASYKGIYLRMDRLYGAVFRDAIDLVRDLHQRGDALAIATSKSQSGVERFVRENDLGPCFEILISNDSVTRPKPHPEMLRLITQHTGIETGLMIGDSTYDIEMGCRAGFATCGVTWGTHDAARLRAAGATTVAETVADLREVLDAT
jgi:phosphoglycolate phosphatase